MARYPALSSTLLGLLLLSLAPLEAASPLLPEAGPALLRIHEFDRPYAVPVVTREVADPEPGHLLFETFPEATELHPSYELTYDFCQRFDPLNGDDEEVSDGEIREYLEQVVSMAPIQEAFRVTRRDSLEDLEKIWFRRGRGFEHVVCGEGSRSVADRLGGFHFWYMHYRYERQGRARFLGADYGRADPLAGLADHGVVTARLTWDPDGPEGPGLELSKQPRGGFTVGHSVAALLAVGHIAYYAPYGRTFRANLNGKAYDWVFYRKWRKGASSVRTFWPRFEPGPTARIQGF